MNDHPPGWRAASLVAAAALGLVACNQPTNPCDCGAVAASAPSTIESAAKSEPAETAPERARAAQQTPAPTEPKPKPAAGTGIPVAADVAADAGETRLALDLAQALFDGRYGRLREAFNKELQHELSEAELAALVDGVVRAHGRPARVMDVWSTRVVESDRTMQGAAVLLRMSRSSTRFRLLFVLNSEGVDGLWLRPL